MRKTGWKFAIFFFFSGLIPCEAATQIPYLAGSISTPFQQLLEWTHHSICSNWGWDIVLLTLFVNIALSPLRWKIWKSSKALERLQPKMEEMRKQHKQDPEQDSSKMIDNLAALQKQEGINPLSSLLWTLIQWPILIGFLRMLSSAKDFAFVSWLWIPNLAAPDPYHGMSVLFLISMALVTGFSTHIGQRAKQQKTIHLASSFLFALMTWKSASALLLYWSCSNLFNFLQQILFQTIHKNPPMT